MGLDPATAQLIAGAGAAAGPVLSQLFAPEGQDLRSFRNSSVDPVAMLTNAHSLINRIGRAAGDRAGQPVSLRSAVVQQPGVATGGGLPMPIGLVAQDPALADPSLLSLPGLGGYGDLFPDKGGDSFGGDFTPDEQDELDRADDKAANDDGSADEKARQDGSLRTAPTGSIQTSTTTRRRAGTGLRGADLLAQDDDDLDQAFGAANLLLEAISV